MKSHAFIVYGVILLTAYVCAPICSAIVINIPVDYPTIQAGVDAAVHGDTVLLADGTYSGSGNRDISFAGIAIAVMSINGPDTCVIDCQGSRADPHRGFKFVNYESEEAVVSGVTIKNGYHEYGGGMLCSSPFVIDNAPTITGCKFENNHAEHGGGIYFYDSRSTITNCRFRNNSAIIAGGAIDSKYSSGLTIGGTAEAGNYFEGNRAPVGADISAQLSTYLIDLRFNSFAGNHLSDYYVTPAESFDMTGCESQMSSITSDVYVAVDGDNSNDGLTFDTPFATIQFAASRILGTELNPVVIHVSEGVYSHATTGEQFPIPLLDYVSISGFEASPSIISSDGTVPVFYGQYDESVSVSYLTIQNGFGKYGGGISSNRDRNMRILHCNIRNNSAEIEGGGIYSVFSEFTVIDDCRFNWNSAGTGGGIFCDSSETLISYCSFFDNRSHRNGGGIYCTCDDSEIITSSFNKNVAGETGGGIVTYASTVVGGLEGRGNSFTDNHAGAGADLFTSSYSFVNASFNSFHGSHESDYYVSPRESFDLTGCVSEMTPVSADLFVSPEGRDSNDGLSWSSPLQTIREATRRIHGTESNPLTIHLAPGRYSPSYTGELFPVAILPGITIEGSGIQRTILNPESTAVGVFAFGDITFNLRNFSITRGWGQSGGGILSYLSSPRIRDLSITHCESVEYGGGIYCDGTGRDEEMLLFNCNISRNQAGVSGGGIYLSGADEGDSIVNCTLVDNTAVMEGGGIFLTSSVIKIFNSILWNNYSEIGPEIRLQKETFPFMDVKLEIDHSDLKGGLSSISQDENTELIWGEGMIDSDPLFTSTPPQSVYLSQVAAGQDVDSPCLDTGNADALDTCDSFDANYCLDSLTTRTDGWPDQGTVDLGIHLEAIVPCLETGVKILMPSDYYYPGDSFFLKIQICNTTPIPRESMPFFVILEISGEFYFAPGFTQFDFYHVNLTPGDITVEIIPEFLWPEDKGSVDGIVVHSAITDPLITEIYGQMDSFTFGFGY